MKYLKIKGINKTSNQHRFVTNKASITNLLETLDILTDAVNDNFLDELDLLDFEKANDKVSHEKLIPKLEEYGVDSILVRRVKAFLSKRKQMVVIGDTFSHPIPS